MEGKKIFLFLFAIAIILSQPNFLFAQEKIIIAGFTSFNKEKNCPVGWELERKTGRPVLSLVKENEILYLHLVSDEASFGIKKEISVDVRVFPYLNWTWKVKKLPPGGDVRDSSKDDQAIQVYLAFPPLGFPARLNTPVIGYIWDTEAPKGWQGRSPQTGGSKVRYIVLRNKSDRIDEWYREKRNVYNDYKILFPDLKAGEPEGPIQGIAFYINSQHTRSKAESLIGNVFFTRN